MIETGAAENGFSVTGEQAERLAQYSSAVLELNNKINLTAIRDEKDFIERNILDSLMIAADIPGSGASIADVGTGGGFPGIPLAVCLPEDSFVLIDSTRKKLDAVEEAAKPLGKSMCHVASCCRVSAWKCCLIPVRLFLKSRPWQLSTSTRKRTDAIQRLLPV